MHNVHASDGLTIKFGDFAVPPRAHKIAATWRQRLRNGGRR